MVEFWNERYALEEYVYGEQPNVFFKTFIDDLKETGNILFPAEGEGRNAVYAAQLGWVTTAFDPSKQAKKKALQLASKHNVEIAYTLDAFESFKPSTQFDLIVLLYTHVPSEKRSAYFRKCIEWLKPNGKLVLEGFSKKQLGLGSGGPKKIDMLFSLDELKHDFSTMHINKLEEIETELNEGKFHQGTAQVVRMIAQNA